MLRVEIGADDARALTALQSRVEEVDDPTLARVLGAPTTRSAEIALTTIVVSIARDVEALCPSGHWCTAGKEIPCSKGTYNPFFGNSSGEACLVCPGLSTTAVEGAEAVQMCICLATYYNTVQHTGALPRGCGLAFTPEVSRSASLAPLPTMGCSRC